MYITLYSIIQRWIKADGKRKKIEGQTGFDENVEKIIVESLFQRLKFCLQYFYVYNT